mmetsp:Transcript_30550/g.66033  ORF Transcript_30550/g.66033 Transcript_30550/m.66033 type:complete len:211 (-) Transcript_30550:815-1447(-)
MNIFFLLTYARRWMWHQFPILSHCSFLGGHLPCISLYCFKFANCSSHVFVGLFMSHSRPMDSRRATLSADKCTLLKRLLNSMPNTRTSFSFPSSKSSALVTFAPSMVTSRSPTLIRSPNAHSGAIAAITPPVVAAAAPATSSVESSGNCTVSPIHPLDTENSTIFFSSSGGLSFAEDDGGSHSSPRLRSSRLDLRSCATQVPRRSLSGVI